MGIRDVLHDLNIYFAGKVTINPILGGWVNASYLEVEYQGRKKILAFWDGKTGEAERELARAFRDDIEAFIKEQAHAIEQERIEESGIPEHQDGDGGGETPEAGGSDSPLSPAPVKRRPKKEVTNLQQTDVA